MSDANSFYTDLPVAADFSAALASEAYRPVPREWILAMTDVVNSTVAIEEGRYKDVTIAGAVGTIAVANLTGDLDFPFLFGGDGMTYLLPGSYREGVLDVLADTIRTVRELSGLELRAGVIAISELYHLGTEVRVGKVRVSPKYVQAMLTGSGLDLADRLLKGRAEGAITFAEESRLEGATRRADYRGFSCRWLDIPSSRGETVSLIIRPASSDQEEALGQMRSASALLREIIEDEAAAHPLSVELQSVAGSQARGVQAEAAYRSRRTRGLRYRFRLLLIRIQLAAVALAVRLNIPLRGMGKQLNRIPQDNIENADVRKFDGTIKMTLALSAEQRAGLLAALDGLEAKGDILYGAHISDRAIMTCLIHTNRDDEVHFVDAADGGYALAARRMKDKLHGAPS